MPAIAGAYPLTEEGDEVCGAYESTAQYDTHTTTPERQLEKMIREIDEDNKLAGRL